WRWGLPPISGLLAFVSEPQVLRDQVVCQPQIRGSISRIRREVACIEAEPGCRCRQPKPCITHGCAPRSDGPSVETGSIVDRRDVMVVRDAVVAVFAIHVCI